MKVAIMQPYIFPYIGYFQLIQAVDVFVFYDDVHFIKRGWINRNRILINNQESLFTIPLKKASQNKLINEVELAIDEKWKEQFFKTLIQNYKKAPYFDQTIVLLENILGKDYNTIASLAISSIISICEYLGIEKKFDISSEVHSFSMGQEKSERLIHITKSYNSTKYVNPSGGKDLYSKALFKSKDINLFFINNEISEYEQYKNTFVPSLSIIDVLMFNSKEQTRKMIDLYKL